MRALICLITYAALFANSLGMRADSLPLPVAPDATAQSANDDTQGPQAFLRSTLVLDPSGVPSGWMLAPLPSGVSSCDKDESVNCLTSADLISKLDPPPAHQEDPIRNNLPEPATWVMLAGGVPLLYGRLRNGI